MGLHTRIYATNEHSMVLHSKLFGDSLVPQWYGCHDFTEDSVQRYSEVQPNGMWGRCTGRIWLEVSAR